MTKKKRKTPEWLEAVKHEMRGQKNDNLKKHIETKVSKAVFASWAMWNKKNLTHGSNDKRSGFYLSRAWREIRYKVLVLCGGRCACCGRSAKDGISLHVDHIKPRSLYPQLALDPNNLQVLCDDCNIGKSNKDETRWIPERPSRITYQYGDKTIHRIVKSL